MKVKVLLVPLQTLMGTGSVPMAKQLGNAGPMGPVPPTNKPPTDLTPNDDQINWNALMAEYQKLMKQGRG